MTGVDQGQPPVGSEWLTLTEAAARSGYSREALRQRVRRGSLASQRRNTDGQIVVRAADLADIPPPDASTTDDPGRPGDAAEVAALAVLRETVDDLRLTVADLTADLGRTRTALDAAQAAHLVDRGRAERAEADAAAAAVRAASGEAAAAEARALAERRAEELAAERLRAAVAVEEAKGLREALAEARRPFWKRWLG